MTETRGHMELVDYVGVLRRRWPSIVLGMLVGVVVAALALLLMPQTYTATTSVLVLPSTGDTTLENGRTSGPVNLDTEAQMVRSHVVAEDVKQTLGSSEDAEDLVRNVTVSVPPNTSVLEISFAAASAEDARDGAQAFADAYLTARGTEAATHAKAAAANLRQQVAELRRDLRKVTARIDRAREGARKTYQRVQKRLLARQMTALQAELVPLVSGDIEPGQVITAATEPPTPSNPSRGLLLVTGLFAGLLAGLVVAAVRERRDHRVRGVPDLVAAGVTPLLGHTKITLYDDGYPWMSGRAGDPFQLLRNALATALPLKDTVIVVAPASDAAASSFVSRNLAITLARGGARTVHVSLARLTEHAPVLAPRGLSDVLAFDCSLDDALWPVPHIANLELLGPGTRPLPSIMMQGPAADAVIAELRETFDVVLVDVPPATQSAEAQTLARHSDGVVLVPTLMHTVREDLVEAVDQFTLVGASILGSASVRDARRRARSGARTEVPGPGDEADNQPAGFTERLRRSVRRARADERGSIQARYARGAHVDERGSFRARLERRAALIESERLAARARNERHADLTKRLELVGSSARTGR